MQYRILVASLLTFAVVGGYFAGLEATGEWVLFSWHPFLMTCGMVGLMGLSTVTKKLGGYTNTKLHGILGWSGLLVSFGGIYAIYQSKENRGAPHYTSTHGKVGLALMLTCVGLGMAGGVFLHPDFGMDKTNKTIRFAHKTASRLTLIAAWMTAFVGLMSLTNDVTKLAMYAVPLVMLVPFVLM